MRSRRRWLASVGSFSSWRRQYSERSPCSRMRATSSASRGRWSGCLRSRSSSNCSSSGETRGRRWEGRGGSRCNCASSIASGVVASAKAWRPVVTSNSTRPRAYRSARGPVGSPRSDSGAAYARLPARPKPDERPAEPPLPPLLPPPCAPKGRARPRSTIFSSLSGVRIRFSGLTSRCTSPRLCSAARPLAASAPMRRVKSSTGWPERSTKSRRVVPGTYCMTRKVVVRPSRVIVSTPWMAARLGWRSD